VTTLLLVRHAAHDLVGKALAGRDATLGLNEAGLRQADALGRRLSKRALAGVFTSPQRRARETARAIGQCSDRPVQIDDALDEIDFGDWTGRTFQELARDPHWKTWVNRRSVARPPNGEAFADVQVRIVDCLTRVAAARGEGAIVIVSHGDVLKAALASYLRCSLDDLERFDIAPASVSIVEAGADAIQVKLVNGTLDDHW
jgi:probable phosphoglycerate mutase